MGERRRNAFVCSSPRIGERKREEERKRGRRGGRESASEESIVPCPFKRLKKPIQNAKGIFKIIKINKK